MTHIYVLTRGCDDRGEFFSNAELAKDAAGASPEPWEVDEDGDWYRPDHAPRVIGREWVPPEVARTQLWCSTNPNQPDCSEGYWRDVHDPDDPYILEAYVERRPVR